MNDAKVNNALDNETNNATDVNGENLQRDKTLDTGDNEDESSFHEKIPESDFQSEIENDENKENDEDNENDEEEDDENPNLVNPNLVAAKNTFRGALKAYLKTRGVPESSRSDKSSTTSASTSITPRKTVLGINVGQDETTVKKVALAQSALAKLEKIKTTAELKTLALAIIAEDIKNEHAKISIRNTAWMISGSSADPKLLKTPNYDNILENYIHGPEKLTLDLKTHPNRSRAKLFKAVYPLLDELAPDAKKCAEIIDAFRLKFKIVSKGNAFSSKYSSGKMSVIDKYKNDIVTATYKLLIKVENQSLESFHKILFNAFALERRATSSPFCSEEDVNHFSKLTFTKSKYEITVSNWNRSPTSTTGNGARGFFKPDATTTSSTTTTTTTTTSTGQEQSTVSDVESNVSQTPYKIIEDKLLTEHKTGVNTDITQIKKRTISYLFREVEDVTELEKFVRDKIKDLSKLIPTSDVSPYPVPSHSDM